MQAIKQSGERQYNAHLASMKRWRDANPDYMKWYFNTHPKQLTAHKVLARKAYWRVRNDPVSWKKYLAYYRKRYAIRKAIGAKEKRPPSLCSTVPRYIIFNG